jgi:hypothetical protein
MKRSFWKSTQHEHTGPWSECSGKRNYKDQLCLLTQMNVYYQWSVLDVLLHPYLRETEPWLRAGCISWKLCLQQRCFQDVIIFIEVFRSKGIKYHAAKSICKIEPLKMQRRLEAVVRIQFSNEAKSGVRCSAEPRAGSPVRTSRACNQPRCAQLDIFHGWTKN